MRSPFKSFFLRRRLIRALGVCAPLSLRAKILCSLLIFFVSWTTKSLQAADLAPAMYTSDRHPFGRLTQSYDLRAVSILNGEGLLGPYNIDPSQTRWLGRAPGYSIFLSAVYAIAGRDFFKVQLFQNAIDSLSAVLIFLIAGLIVGWRVGAVAGVITALSHHLGHFSNFILPDSLCALPLLAAAWLLARAYRLHSHPYWLYALAGLLIGFSTWLRPQAMLEGIFIALMLVVLSKSRRKMASRAAVLVAASLLTIAPITVRNYIVYGEFVPVALGTGVNLWEGIADASGDRFGAVATDVEVAAQEAILYNKPEYAGSHTTPDGIKRDRDRTRKSLDIIIRHPFWYAGVMVDRMGYMLKYSAHAPLVFRSDQVKTFEKTDAIRKEWQSVAPERATLALGAGPRWLRLLIRPLQRLTKEAMQLFILAGLIAMFLLSARRSLFLLIIPFYYLLFQSFLHTEFRFALPMHYFLFVFAAATWTLLGAAVWRGVISLLKRIRAKSDA